MNLDWVTEPRAAFTLVVTMLAAFRLTRVIVSDAFPLGVQRARFTDWANERWPAGQAMLNSHRTAQDASGLDFPSPPTVKERREYQAYEGMAPLAYFATCYWCAGLYVSVLSFLLACTGMWWLYVAIPLAVSAVVGLLGTHD